MEQKARVREPLLRTNPHTEVAQFVRDLATSRVLYVRIRSLNAPRTSAEFRVDGAPGAIEAGLAGCPVKASSRTADARR
jgi:hypothetical protein